LGVKNEIFNLKYLTRCLCNGVLLDVIHRFTEALCTSRFPYDRTKHA